MFILSTLEDNVRVEPQVGPRAACRACLLRHVIVACGACAAVPAGTSKPCPAPRAAASQDLDKPPAAAITTQLEHSFVDRVVDGLGLVVTLYDVLSVGDGHVYPSDGGAHYRRAGNAELAGGRVLREPA